LFPFFVVVSFVVRRPLPIAKPLRWPVAGGRAPVAARRWAQPLADALCFRWPAAGGLELECAREFYYLARIKLLNWVRDNRRHA
jgi:hypothetical protein